MLQSPRQHLLADARARLPALAIDGHLCWPKPGYFGGDPISPELVLVDPELAQIARVLLPDRHDWTIDFAPRTRPLPEPVEVGIWPEPTRSSPFVRATQIGAALLLALALFGALGAEQLRRSSRDLALAPPPVSHRGAETPTTKAKVRARTGVRRPRRAEPQRPTARVARTAVRKNRRSARSSARKTSPRVTQDTAKRTIGRRVKWARTRVGPATSVRREGRTCRMEWASLKLTLIVSVASRHTPCSEGTVVATIVAGKQSSEP
jgi:hypothetical protein